MPKAKAKAKASEPNGFDRCANLAGALALAVVDRVSGAVAAATEVSETPAAALSALHFFIERPTIDTLRQVLGVTSSGAVRMVDRLEQLGYVKRRPGDDVRRAHALGAAGGRAGRARPRWRAREGNVGADDGGTGNVREAARARARWHDARTRCRQVDLPAV
jgi:MarR family